MRPAFRTRISWTGRAPWGRILCTQDSDLLHEAARRQRTGQEFGGLVYAHQLKVTIGQCLRGLELMARFGEPEDFRSWVEYLPLR